MSPIRPIHPLPPAPGTAKRYSLADMASSKVVALHLKPETGVLQPVDSLKAVNGKGFEGDRFFGRDSRQALLVSTRHIEEFGFQPGTFREQITVDMPELQELESGVRLKVGEVTMEIEKICDPCGKMARYVDEEKEPFVAKTALKRGIFAKILSDGQIRVGDAVQVIGG